MGKRLINALDPDKIAEAALAAANTKDATRDEDNLTAAEFVAAKAERVAAVQVNRRWQEWIFRHNARRGNAFTTEQTEWLRLIKDHIAASCAIARDDFDYAPFADKGGLQKAWGLFGSELDGLMKEMNEELAA